jgi:hypothetical protein
VHVNARRSGQQMTGTSIGSNSLTVCSARTIGLFRLMPSGFVVMAPGPMRMSRADSSQVLAVVASIS